MELDSKFEFAYFYSILLRNGVKMATDERKNGQFSQSEDAASPKFADFDFRFDDNPAVNGQKNTPVFPLSGTSDDEELNSHPEMDFRRLAGSIAWGDTGSLTHGIQKLPAIFIPHIPRYLIDTFSAENNEDGEIPKILDPFCGSGTTGIEAKVAGRNFVGVEINPLSKLVSEVSTTPIPYTVIRNTKDELNARFDNTNRRYYEEFDVEFLDQTQKHHWFTDVAIEGLTTIRKVVSEFIEDDSDLLTGLEPRERKVLRDLEDKEMIHQVHVPRWLILLIANTVFRVSNADPAVSKAHKSSKMRDLIENDQHPPDPIGVYRDQLDNTGSKLIDYWNEVYGTNAPGGSDQTDSDNGEHYATFHRYADNWVSLEENKKHQAEIDIRLGDARSFQFNEHLNDVDLAITSPPYINAINYYRGTKLRLFWIHDMLEECSNLDAESLRRSFIGTNSVSMKDVEGELPLLLINVWNGDWDGYRNTTLPDLDEHILRIHNGDLTEAKNRAYITWKFFAEDMFKNLTSVYRHLKPGAYYIIVIGENTIGGQRIQNHRFVADIAQNLGKFKSLDGDIGFDEGYRLVGMAWDNISNHDLFFGRNHENGVIEREWIVMLQKPKA